MNVAYTIASLSRKAAGVSASMFRLANELSLSRQHAVHVYGVHDEHTNDDMAKLEPAFCWRSFKAYGPQALAFAPSMKLELLKNNHDLVHTHGIWMYPSIATLQWARRADLPYVISPHGMLDPWAIGNAGWKKRIAALLYERAHLTGASCIHALNEAEAKAIRAYGLKNPICIVPNGIDLPLNQPQSEPAWKSRLPNGAKILLYLGRLHPKKGLVNLLRSWAALNKTSRKEIEPWHLVIAGWDQGGHGKELESLADELGITRTAHFAGAQFGEDKHATYQAADAFILPSLSEGLPMVVLEAWAYRLPVLMTDACNLPEGFQSGAALRINPSVESITSRLIEFFEMTCLEQEAAGLNGYNMVKEEYTWLSVAEKMSSLYQSVRDRELKKDQIIG